jgi:PAS domain S-box-containing protein
MTLAPREPGMLMLPDYPQRQRDLLLEISRAITEQLDLGEVLRRVLRASILLLAGRVGLIALRQEGSDSFRVRAALGVPEDQIAAINEGLQALIVEGVQAGDKPGSVISEQLRAMGASIDPGLQQAIAMPLRFGGEPLGLLVIFRSYQSETTGDDLRVLQSFADQAAIAVHNAQLYTRLERESKQLEAILQYSGDGVFLLDADLRIRGLNRAFEALTGWAQPQAVGLEHDDIIRWQRVDQPGLTEIIRQGWPDAKGDRNQNHVVQGELIRNDGGLASVGITYAPILSVRGGLVNIVANVRDISSFRRAQDSQNTFISMVSHELRTPVALIKGYATTLNREDAHWDSKTIADALTVIEEEADRLNALIEDLLTASRLQTLAEVQLALDHVRLDRLAREAVQRQLPQSSKHRFAVTFPEDFPEVVGDAGRLRQVLDNLIVNAMKYSPQGGTITVGGRFSNQDVTVFVRDEGVGIAREALDHVFERFYRVDNHLSRSTQGTGLGLYLVKAIVEAHQGTVRARSQVGQGSIFLFTLPRAA